jgi:ubiquinone/menaquinone biosynthesis C-methylase UbiE
MESQSWSTKFALRLLNHINIRNYEFGHAMRFLKDCDTILDVGCGKGTFIENDPKRIAGIDVNPVNVEICKGKGYNVQQGDALKIPHNDNTFDGVFASHLIHIFDYQGALQLLNELRRVTKPGGSVVLVTFPDHRKLYYSPETFRAYPPHAIRSLTKQPEDFLDPAATPTYPNAPKLKQEGIKLIRPALIELEWPKTAFSEGVASMINLLQHAFYIRKYWAYNSYVIHLRNQPKA